MTLPTTTLGANGPVVGVQGLGCMTMSNVYGAADPVEARATLERALELGVTVFDTADAYGDNEDLLSPFVRAHRDDLLIATKFALETRDDDPTYLKINNSPDYIRQSVDRSLRRLGVEVIDLYYIHRHDPEVPFAESVGAMAELVQAGKVRHLGLCEVTGDARADRPRLAPLMRRHPRSAGHSHPRNLAPHPRRGEHRRGQPEAERHRARPVGPARHPRRRRSVRRHELQLSGPGVIDHRRPSEPSAPRTTAPRFGRKFRYGSWSGRLRS
ncbi:aldo/keto reductase [Nonomuraea angiospora]